MMINDFLFGYTEKLVIDVVSIIIMMVRHFVEGTSGRVWGVVCCQRGVREKICSALVHGGGWCSARTSGRRLRKTEQTKEYRMTTKRFLSVHK